MEADDILIMVKGTLVRNFYLFSATACLKFSVAIGIAVAW